jgi:hypothetical protein
MGSDENFEKSRSYSKEDFMAYYGNVSGNSEDDMGTKEEVKPMMIWARRRR